MGFFPIWIRANESHVADDTLTDSHGAALELMTFSTVAFNGAHA